MKTFISRAKKFVLYIFAAVLVGGSPMAAFAAEEAAPSEEDGGYVFDEATGRWNSNKWRYDPAINNYVPNTPPPAPVNDETVTDTGPNSNNETEDGTDQNSTQNNTSNNNQINNDVSGKAKTGDATVSSNNTAGGATSGDATSIATIMNAINSSSALSSQPYTFTKDVYGNVYGDIVLAPELLRAMSETTSSPQTGTVNYNVIDKNTINNNVDLGADTGNASVINNTNAGGATSGNATAIANVLNIINSVIAANKSFVGTINIHGNLDGDILMSKQGSPALITSNAGSNPLNQGNLIANQNNLTNIINDIELDATTGTAMVDGNTNAGNAKSGTANTNLVVMDLSGRMVTAKNSLLVFVNVLGKWVGIIVDAPTGATAAVLGDDVTSNLIAAAEGDAMINADSQNQIINNIKVGAHTGDATVAGNTNAGDATTGNASASATILNMANSAFSVSDWFGVLFINVLGSWYGSFGVDTPQGDEVAASSPPPTSEQPEPASAPAQVFSFIERHIVMSDDQSEAAVSEAESAQSTQASVLAASDHSKIAPITTTESDSSPTTVSMPIAIAALVGLSVVAGLVIRLIGALRERFARIA